jgi:hypothetical protein
MKLKSLRVVLYGSLPQMQINPLQGVERVGIERIFKDLANRLGFQFSISCMQSQLAA